MSRNCILVLFLPFIWIHLPIIKPKLPFTVILLTKTDETNDVSGIDRVNLILSHGNFSVGLSFRWGSPWGFLQCFSRSELMKQEPRHHLVLNCLHSTFAVEQLLIHFRHVWQRNVMLRRAQSLFLSVILFAKSLSRFTQIRQIRCHCFTCC